MLNLWKKKEFEVVISKVKFYVWYQLDETLNNSKSNTYRLTKPFDTEPEALEVAKKLFETKSLQGEGNEFIEILLPEKYEHFSVWVEETRV